MACTYYPHCLHTGYMESQGVYRINSTAENNYIYARAHSARASILVSKVLLILKTPLILGLRHLD